MAVEESEMPGNHAARGGPDAAAPAESARPWSRSGELVYGGVLFAAAAAALVLASDGSTLAAADWPQALFFLLFGLFTISIGYSHPVVGYVSFDRVAQVSSVLVLGPVDAAWINGLASLVYPWHRLRKGVPLRAVCIAALTNAGLMSLMVLGAGLLYVGVGGPVPLEYLAPGSFGAIALMLVTMQAINEGGMMTLARVRGRPVRESLSLSDTLTEMSAGLVAILVAIVWTRMEAAVLMLLLVVLAAGMLALKRFAEMRLTLERLVDERTGELREKSLQLERLAEQDTLTGLYNRRHADGFLGREIAHAARDGHPLGIALADIDHFKQINDEHSHGVGDRVLERVARIFAGRMRESDLVARYGGEEFLFCFAGSDETEAARRCEDLRAAVEGEDWARLSPGLRVTLSIGLAMLRDEADATAVLSRADTCLYQAKRLGRNRVVTSASLRTAPRA
jgi:diguanylate cyclase (GGDEF)-like protein